jgi:hypothetical protein
MLENTVQGGQQLGGAVHDAIEPATGKQPVADLQEILGGRIQVADGQAVVEQDHRRRQQVKPAEWISRSLRHGRRSAPPCPTDQRRLAISFWMASTLR